MSFSSIDLLSGRLSVRASVRSTIRLMNRDTVEILNIIIKITLILITVLNLKGKLFIQSFSSLAHLSQIISSSRI